MFQTVQGFSDFILRLTPSVLREGQRQNLSIQFEAVREKEIE